MSDKRINERTSVIEFQQVQDASTAKVLGYLGDISLEGLRLLSKRAIPIGEKYQLRLRYMLKGGGTETVAIDVKSVWEREDDSLPYRETGFHLIDPSDAARASIEVIVKDLRDRWD